MSRYVINFNLDELDLASGDTVVDVGCGDGPFDQELVRVGINVIGVEPEAYLRERFQQWADHLGPGKASVVDGTAERLPFEAGSVGALIITEVLEHVEDPTVCLAEIGRVMRPGGRICVSVPTKRTEWLYWRLHPDYEENSTHLRVFSKRDLRRQIERAGFRIRRIEGRNFAAALTWTLHALLRTKSDHAGKIHTNRWIEPTSNRVWGVLNALYVGRLLTRVGNRIWPKSWYVYAERRS